MPPELTVKPADQVPVLASIKPEFETVPEPDKLSLTLMVPPDALVSVPVLYVSA